MIFSITVSLYQSIIISKYHSSHTIQQEHKDIFRYRLHIIITILHRIFHKLKLLLLFHNYVMGRYKEINTSQTKNILTQYLHLTSVEYYHISKYF